MQSAIEYAAIPTINLTPLFLVTNPLTNSSKSDTLQVKSSISSLFCTQFVRKLTICPHSSAPFSELSH